MVPIVFVMCLTLGLSQAATTTTKNPFSRSFNGTKVADMVLDEVRKGINATGMNDIHLPNQNFTANGTSVKLTNGTVKNLANIQRVGDVILTVEPRYVKLRSAYGVNNVTADQDVYITSRRYNATNGHVYVYSENVTVYTVFKFDYFTQDFTLDEFEVTAGNTNGSITGMGDRLANDSVLATKIVNTTKGPLLTVFSIAFRLAFNAAIKAVKTAIISSG